MKVMYFREKFSHEPDTIVCFVAAGTGEVSHTEFYFPRRKIRVWIWSADENIKFEREKKSRRGELDLFYGPCEENRTRFSGILFRPLSLPPA